MRFGHVLLAGFSSEGRLAEGPTDGYFRARLTAVVLILSALGGLWLRISIARQSGLWRDEALCLFVTRLPTLSDLLAFLHYHESHPPLFYLLLRGWLALFGPSTASALALPILFGALLPPVAYWVGRRTFSPRVGLLSCVLVALSPDLAVYSGQVRPYSLMPLLGLLSVFFLWQGLRGGGWKSWLGYGVSTLALLYAHHWGWLVEVAEWALVIASMLFVSTRPGRRGAQGFLLAQAAILLGYLPWLPALLYQMHHAGHGASGGSLRFPVVSGFFSTVFLALGNNDCAPYPLNRIMALPLLAVLVVGLIASYKAASLSEDRLDPRRLALLLYVGVPLFAFGLALALIHRANLLFPYCYLTVAPPLLVALSLAIVSLPGPRRWPWAVPALAACLIAGYYGVAVMTPGRFRRSNARELAAAVFARAHPNDLIVIAPEWLSSSFNYYYRGNNPQIDYPHVGREGAVEFDGIYARQADPLLFRRFQAQMVAVHAAGQPVWLILNRPGPLPDLPAGTDTPATDPGLAGVIRSSPQMSFLTRLYGPPRALRAGSGCATENLEAFLFTPRNP